MDEVAALRAPMFAMLTDDMNELGYVDLHIIHFFQNVSNVRWKGFALASA